MESSDLIVSCSDQEADRFCHTGLSTVVPAINGKNKGGASFVGCDMIERLKIGPFR